MRHRPRLFYAALFTGFFALMLVVVGGLSAVQVQRNLEAQAGGVIREIENFSSDLLGTMSALDAPPPVPACSEPFLRWMRGVSFRPDRINEILYAPNGIVACTVGLGRVEEPMSLGLPNFALLTTGVDDNGKQTRYRTEVWQDADLEMIGYPGSRARLLGVENFVLVVPDIVWLAPMQGGIQYETVWRVEGRDPWHYGGTPGLYASLNGLGGDKASATAGFTATLCDQGGSNCIAVLEPLGPLLSRHPLTILGLVGLAAALAASLTYATKGHVQRSWSLASRVKRRLSDQTVACLYQPLLDLKIERISSVEVLARWRDDDGSMVPPDTFLPIVEKNKLQRRFTRHVVDRAYRELSGLDSLPQPLLVHFNIFPIDFDPDWMLELFEDFLADKSRFTVVIELVESDVLPIDTTRDSIARLKAAGILTFIDDFGVGYSSIGYLAGLGTHGVKLDRSFGMAPEGSLMDAMMVSAIEMVTKTGQVLVVEGVETLGRLAWLSANANVDIAQGYFISRPVDAASLEALLNQTQFLPKKAA